MSALLSLSLLTLGKIGLERGELPSLTGSSVIITQLERREPGAGHCLLSCCPIFPTHQSISGTRRVLTPTQHCPGLRGASIAA